MNQNQKIYVKCMLWMVFCIFAALGSAGGILRVCAHYHYRPGILVAIATSLVLGIFWMWVASLVIDPLTRPLVAKF